MDAECTLHGIKNMKGWIARWMDAECIKCHQTRITYFLTSLCQQKCLAKNCLREGSSTAAPDRPVWPGYLKQWGSWEVTLTWGVTLMVAMSNFLSMSLMLASCTWPSWVCTRSCCWPDTGATLVTTWALVTMRPVSDTIKPDPLDRGTLRPKRGCLGEKQQLAGR